ncbi:hypothetical protein DFH06DRAFT_122957 [Mycena polygramma]|nr:hypothetical protein DFH06DRAFT_122957 [Mycena polygramma]
MPRRAAPRPAESLDSDHHQLDPTAPSSDRSVQNLANLRKHWKWAAFSQFFYTFSHLFAMEDVSLTDIEDDLARETNIFLPRVMTRLLFILSYDRKASLDNWQSVLRKQHNRRDPASNPIGPEPHTEGHEARYRYESVSVDEPAAGSGDDATMEPRDHVAEADPDVAASDRAASALPDVPRGNTEETAGPDVVPKEEEEEQESKDWLDLPMSAKLDSMHLLTEWQFQNPTRLRTLMKSDDDDATWRIEPIGYDAKSNAYWLIGADRLWIQRAHPKPPRYTATTSSLKRKRPENMAKANTAKTRRPAAKRARLASEDPKLTITVPSVGRAAKTQAKIKLDAQAKELAELNRAAGIKAPTTRTSHGSRNPVAPVRPLGTRISARLRGADDDEWQAVPEDWLAEGGSKKKALVKPTVKTGLESDNDSVSDLTELSEEAVEMMDEEEEEEKESSPPPEVAEAPPAEDAKEDISLDGFVEWETICVTLSDWEHIAERFEKGTHYTEKALYKVLVKEIVPVITEELREIERKRRLEEAIVHRKRSSRIASKEQEKEEARLLVRQKAEVAEKKNRAQRLEARLAKEEAERERREAAREQRRKDKEAQETESADGEESTDMPVDVVGHDPSPIHLAQIPPDTSQRNGGAASTSGTRTPMGDDWVLNCEICLRSGVNLDDGMSMLCCGLCSQWHHTKCHDYADKQAGRPRRNWDQVDFICRQCQMRLAAKNPRHYSQHEAVSSPYMSQGPPSTSYMPTGPPSTSYPQHRQGLPPPAAQPHPARDYHGTYPVAANGVSAYAQSNNGAGLSGQLPYTTLSSVNYRAHGQPTPPPPPRLSAGPTYGAPRPQQQQYQEGMIYDQFASSADVRAPAYQRPVAQGWNIPANPSYGVPSNGVSRRVESERHQYGDVGQWHGGPQQTAAYGYHNGH